MILRVVRSIGSVLRPEFANVILFAAGAAMCMSFLRGPSPTSWLPLLVATGVLTLVWIGSRARTAASRFKRWLGWSCWLALGAFHALWIYVSIAMGILLAWTVPGGTIFLVVVAAIGVAATFWRNGRIRVPMVLPLGIWVAALLSGWLREEQLLHCDDYLSLRPPLQVVVQSNPNLDSCRPGEVRRSGRFPRTIWQDPDGKRVVFTTQGSFTPGGIDGAVCEALLDGTSAPHCVGPPLNKSQGLTDIPERDRLLVLQWGLETPSGSVGAVVYELSRSAPLEILAEHWFKEMVAEGFYEPRNSMFYMFSDHYNGIHPARLPSFERVPTIPAEFAPGELQYDQKLGQGVACGAQLGAAIQGAPFSVRYFVDANASSLERLAVTWGCNWDPVARKVYTTVPNFGLLDRIDYDTGRVEKRWFVGPGMRSVEYDRVRRRVYFTDFLRGYVLALDEASGVLVNRWFVGRFSRWVRLTRDGRALLATGNLGIVRIPLDS